MKAKTNKIFLNDAGSFLGRGEGCLIVRDRKRNEQTTAKNQKKIAIKVVEIQNNPGVTIFQLKEMPRTTQIEV